MDKQIKEIIDAVETVNKKTMHKITLHFHNNEILTRRQFSEIRKESIVEEEQ